MNYEKKYREALSRAKEIYNRPDATEGGKIILESMFPELRESEDERIRKEITEYITRYKDCITDKEYNSWISWLEMQGEQKPVDNVEPKFKVGDWITNGEYNWTVTDIQPLDYILQSQNGKVVDDTISYVDEEFHLWTIQDAKDDDVLEFGDHGRLVVGIVSYVNKTTGKVDVNCLLEYNNFKVGNYYNLDTIKPHPATKEQRELLFQKMKEAGYEWNAEKKELKKIEQKTTWSEEDEKRLNHLIEFIQKFGFEYYASTDKVIDWLKSLKDRVQPKQEWNEDDERIYNEIIDFFLGDVEKRCTTIDKQRHFGYWLKSLRPRHITYELDAPLGYDNYMNPIYPPINHWKPSEEQMEALECSYKSYMNGKERRTLESLYNDLKRL